MSAGHELVSVADLHGISHTGVVTPVWHTYFAEVGSRPSQSLSLLQPLLQNPRPVPPDE
jgi:hypothetical protein